MLGQQGLLGGLASALMVSFPRTAQRAAQLGIVREDQGTCRGATQGSQDRLRHHVPSLCSSPARVEEEEEELPSEERGGYLNDWEVTAESLEGTKLLERRKLPPRQQRPNQAMILGIIFFSF